ncbi:MAG: hypothetical protein M3015_14460 [Bacteroidota bacterium]|nr:hypothetical protein [Bacteroidota bacterium]
METIHLKTSKSFIEREDFSQSKKVIDKFIESSLQLDISIFEPYMDEDDVFEDKEKYMFLADLKRSFDNIRNLAESDFNITIEDRKCNGCSSGKMVKHFEVFNKKTNSYIGSFGFLIDVENGILKNIYRCLRYKETKKVFVKPEGLPGIFIKKHIEPDLLK